MKNKSFLGILLIIFIFSLAILSCSPEGSSKVTITINLGLQNKAALNTYENSIFDRVFRFFAKDAEAQSAPSNISSLTLNITGAGMATITKSYTTPIPDTITIEEVPSGSSRTFELLAYTPSATLRGAATCDLAGGANVTIPISMGLYETKIVLLDPQNSRLVQIDDMNGNGWKTMTSAYTTISPAFYVYRPQDVAFDARGRIYIANNTSSTFADHIIYRVDSIPGDPNIITAQVIVDKAAGITRGIEAIAIDMKNSILYYAIYNSSIGYSNLYSTGLDGGTPYDYNLPSLITLYSGSYIYGISVDDDGLIYIAYTNHGGTNIIVKFDPIGLQIINTFDFNVYYGNQNHAPYDIVVKSGNVYAAITGYVVPNQHIIQLNSNLQFVASYGTGVNTSSNSPGDFYGPLRFVAKLNRKLYICDDGGVVNVGGGLDKLVAMDDISGNGWVTYGSYGSGVGQFNFYYGC
jgi:hypothetical protein